jgi:hypothetical protein
MDDPKLWFPRMRRLFGEFEFWVTSPDLRIDDLFVASQIVTSRRDFRNVKHNLRVVPQVNDATVLFLARLNKSGFLKTGKFCILV